MDYIDIYSNDEIKEINHYEEDREVWNKSAEKGELNYD